MQDKGWVIKRTPAIRRLLRKSNHEIAGETGISLGAIQRLRGEYAIPAPRLPRRHEWPPELLARLGKEPDETIAAERGIRRQTVAAKRSSLGIPRFRGR